MQKLLKNINKFYKVATSHYLKVLAQTAPDLYAELVNAVQNIKDPEIASEVGLISELYKKALQLNNGYSYVNETLSRFINMLDDDTQGEQEAIENLINKVSRDLRLRTKNNPDTAQAIQTLKNDKQIFNNQLMNETTQALQNGSDLEKIYELPKGELNSGATFFAPKSYKDWIIAYQNEKERYQEELNDPKLWQAKDRRGAATRNNLEDLIKVLNQLIDTTKQTNQLYSSLSVQERPDSTDQNKFNELGQKITELQNKRNTLKIGIRKYMYSKITDTLNNELQSTTNEQDKLLLQAKLDLYNLQSSNDYNKGEEAKWRKFLVRALTADRNLPLNQIAKIQEKINEAKTKTIPAKKQHEELSKDIAKLKGQKAKTTDERSRGTLKDRYDWDNISLEGLITHLTQRIATERQSAKEKITKAIEDAKQDPNLLKPYMDDLARAATKKDKAAILDKTKQLRDKMEQIEKDNDGLITFVASLRTSKFFYAFRDKVAQIQEWQADTQLSTEQLSFLNETIIDGKKILDFYTGKNLKSRNNDILKKYYYAKPSEIVSKIITKLEQIKTNNLSIEASLFSHIFKG